MSTPELNQTIAHQATVFAALGDATRLQLIQRLSTGESLSIKKLRHGLSISRQGVTKHIKVLEQAGILVRKRQGREQHFMILPKSIQQAEDYLSKVSQQWDDALQRLQDFVEPH
ncbi:ArsR/SmtB family transcription factor [Marinicella sp. W31]|uniref:ArsR/SmtB family transcription factor n=1 Tax=Marinicella sp. W31 TaxID=3023713 RepID=UPI0037583757